jgi:hypothetical protein
MTPPWCETVRSSVAVGLSSGKLVQARAYRLSCLDEEKWQRCSSLRCSRRPLSIFLSDPPGFACMELSKAEEMNYGERKAHASPTDAESS